MGHTNSTANLSLPQFIGTDKPTWLSDVNGAFAAIDSYAGSNDAALAIVDGKANTAIGDASSAVTTATNAANTAGNAATTATNANTIAGNALTVANGINSKVGVLTDLTTTDKSTVVNAINEVNAAVGTLPTASQVSYDNTGSGLVATNVQDAIDEVAQGGGGSSTYTLIGTETGTSPITIPAGLNELYVEVESTNEFYTIPILTAQLSATEKIYATGFYNTSSSYGAVMAKVSDTSIYLLKVAETGSDVTASANITVYGR